MATLDKYIEELKNQGESGLNKKKEALKETAESDKNIINANADNSLQSIRDGYNADVADVNESYEDAFRKNEVQVKLNERYLERKAAEMGLTDSGMNRTQMTANQLSYANQKGELTAQKQKAIDTLAAAMRAKITEVDTKRNDALAEVDSTLKEDLAQADMDFDKSIRETATDIVKADKEAESKYTYIYDSNGQVVGKYTDDERENAWNNLCTLFDEGENVDLNNARTLISDFAKTYGASGVEQQILYNKAIASNNKTSKNTENETNWLNKYESFLTNLINEDFSPEYKLNLIENFSDTYGFESIKQANDALKRAGLDEYYFSENGMLQQTEEALEQQKNNKTYTIRKTNDTWNGFLGIKGLLGGIDSNDTYEIVDDETDKVVKTIKNIDDFSSLTTEQKRKLSKLNINEEISTSDFNFSSDGFRRFIESISKE